MPRRFFIAGAATAMQQGPQFPEHFEQVSYARLADWERDDHSAALAGFLRFCGNPGANRDGPAGLQVPRSSLRQLCLTAELFRNERPAGARDFFETHFTPFRITERGFVTGYFEPEVAASRTKNRRLSGAAAQETRRP
ncbi:MltA domain-containing protein [Roseibium salinum]|nr:MltA domain-containing protein [Roseibium salinum]